LSAHSRAITRRLHRLSLLLLVALLCAPLLACGGRTETTNDGACPGWLPARERTLRQPTSEGVGAGMRTAATAALDYYVAPYDAEDAVSKAWSAASLEARQAGYSPPAPAIQSPSWILRYEAYLYAFDDLEALIEGSPDERRITDAALEAFANAFHDDHTYYLSKRRWDAFQQGGNFSYGLHAERFGDKRVVTDVLPGSRAMQAGILPGDLIISGDPPADAGSPSEVRLQIQRRQGGQVVELQVAPEPLSWVRHELVQGEIGYLRLYEFPSFTSCEGLKTVRAAFDDAIVDLQKQGAKAWIDLRDNGGGAGESAAFVAPRLGFDGLLVTSRYKNGYREPMDILEDNAIGNAPLAILINRHSASSSEIVAYALQDARRAQVVGTQSAGAVVAAFGFPAGGGAFFVTGAFVEVGPGNKVLDKIGVTPNTRVTLDLDLLQREGRDSQLEAATTYLKQKLGR
jgi:carboxyl-terminal processing protease